MSSARPPKDGWHWKEWSAELVGTAVMLFAVVTAKDFAVGAGPPASDLWARAAIVGAVAGTIVVGVAFSPLGRRSGGHLNPAVTIGFWVQNVIGHADFAGYCAAQLAGGILGVGLARVWGPHVGDPNVQWAVIAPATWLFPPAAAAIEAGATFAQLLLVYALLTGERYRVWAPVVAGVTLAALIAALANVSGAGFNPVRGLAPDVVADIYPAVWIYAVGPVVGAAAAGGAVIGWGRRSITGKLHHDPTIRCHMRCELPHHPAVLPSREPTGRAAS